MDGTRAVGSHEEEDGKNPLIVVSWAATRIVIPLTVYFLSPRGNVTNIRFENFHVEGSSAGASINQNSGDNGMWLDVSLFAHLK